MAITVTNPATGRLVIAGVHEGACGIAAAPDGDGIDVAFRWGRGARRPEQALGATATLDGVAHRVVAAARSAVTDGFYVVRLVPAAPRDPAAG